MSVARKKDVHKAFGKPAKNYPNRFEERRMLLKPFVKKHKTLVVHGVKDPKIFDLILRQGELKLPKQHTSQIKCPYMAKLLGIDNSVFFSVGFVYATAYDFSFNFIFDGKILSAMDYYRMPVISHCYKAVINYWDEHDVSYLQKLAHYDSTCREVVDKYLAEKASGKERPQFDFWRIEETVYNFIKKYPRKESLFQAISAVKKDLHLKYPRSLKHAIQEGVEAVPEIVSLKSVSLSNPHFVGFYVNKPVTRKLAALLQKRFAGKIIFDGKIARRI